MADTAPWYILGAGAMGTVLAHRLAMAGVAAELLDHRRGGERCLIVDGREHTVAVRALSDCDPGSIRRLLLATKAPQVEAAMRAARARLAENAVALTIANGIGFARQYDAPGATLTLHRAVSTAAAYGDGEGRVVLAAVGETYAGSGAAGPAGWFTDSLAGLDDWHWDAAIEARVGVKFAINCIVNPLTATLRCRNGELLTEAPALRALRALCEETVPALTTLGMWPPAKAPLFDAVCRVCRATAMNRSSMLQDVLAGRPTEIEFLTGELLRRAGAAGLELPQSEALYRRITGRG